MPIDPPNLNPSIPLDQVTYVKHGALLAQDAFESVGMPDTGRGAYFPSIINVGSIVRRGEITLDSSIAGANYLMYVSEDHGSAGGIWLATAQSLRGPWAAVDGGGNEGQIVDYTASGSGQETPEVFWSPKLQKLVMISHNQSLGRSQSSYVLTSTDGVTWVAGSPLQVLDIPASFMSEGHTGYIRVHQRPSGTFVGMGLSSGTDNSRLISWYSADGQVWETSRGAISMTWNGRWARTADYVVNIDDVIYHNGEKYGIGRHRQGVAAGGATTPGQLWLFKMGKSDSAPVNEPIVEVPMGGTGEPDENGFISPKLFSDNGKLYCVYIGRGDDSPTDLNTIMLVEFK